MNAEMKRRIEEIRRFFLICVQIFDEINKDCQYILKKAVDYCNFLQKLYFLVKTLAFS